MARQARSLDVLVAEVNALSPERSKISDGGLGDSAHASRASDHNVNAAGVWRARDFTDDDTDDDRDGGDFGDVFDCGWLAEQLVAMYHAPVVHPAMRSGAYTIHKGRIYSYDRRDEGWRPYTGSNPHNVHLHQSVATLAAGYDSTAPWLKETDDMFTDDDRQKIADTATELAKLTKRFDRFADNSWRREAALAKALKEQGVDVDKILAAVTES